MRKTLALVAAMSIASASIALPAQAAQKFGQSHPSNFGGFISSVLHFGFKPQPPFPPPQVFNGVCRILEVDWLVEACQASFPGGGASPS
jgi:hypothetical protein